MTREEVLAHFRKFMRPVEERYIGANACSKHLMAKLQDELQTAAFKAYDSLPMAYRDHYEIPLPVIRELKFNRATHAVDIKWKTKTGWLFF